MEAYFDYDKVTGLSNALGGRVDLLEKVLGLKVRENLKYSDIQKIVQSGFAEEFFDLGDEIMTKYTATDGTEYDFPWRVVDFRDVTWEDGTEHPGMVLQAKYATVEKLAYDTDGNKKSEWTHCDLRQWLNSDAEKGNWWTEQYEEDLPPSTLNTYNGFIRGFDESFISVLTNTKNFTSSSDELTVVSTYDKFYIASPSEMYATSIMVAPSPAFSYWVKEVGTKYPSNTACVNRVINSIDDQNAPCNYATRYCFAVPNMALLIIYGSTTGAVNSASACTSLRNVLPCCVIS